MRDGRKSALGMMVQFSTPDLLPTSGSWSSTPGSGPPLIVTMARCNKLKEAQSSSQPGKR